MKLIDADALMRYGAENQIVYSEDIDLAPSIDIVFCKECKHGYYEEKPDMYICDANGYEAYNAEHFCSYGEREGE